MTETPSSPPKDPRPPQVQAIGIIEDAMSYVETAKVLDEATKNRHNYWPPVFFLLAHAIELILKAYLYSAGTRDKDLRAIDVRHNLTRLLEKAEAAGFRPAHESFAEAVEWLAPYHQDHRFRYRKPGLISLPKPELLAQIVSDTGDPLRQLIRERYFATTQASEQAAQDQSGD